MVPKICSVEDCEKPARGRGWCVMHYYRWRTHGDPLSGPSSYSTPEQAFTARTRWDGECLVWTGSTNGAGYGEMRTGKRKRYVHRYAWECANGPIPDGLVIDHICRNRACCNVAHLRVVTVKQNNEHAGVSSHNTSGHRGVSWDKSKNKWRAYVSQHDQYIHAGYFADIHEASVAARAMRLELYTHNTLDRAI